MVRDVPRSLVSAEPAPEGGNENFAAQVDRMPVGAIDPASLAPPSVTLAPPAPSLPPPELSRFASAAALYRKGDRAGADALAAQISDPFQRAALQWVALKSAPDRDHLVAFEAAHKDWPAADWMRDMREGWLYSERAPAATVEALFAHDPPQTPAGVLAAARAALDGGRKDKATSLVRGLWRDLDLDYGTEGKVLREFGVLLTRADHNISCRPAALRREDRVGVTRRRAGRFGRSRAGECSDRGDARSAFAARDSLRARLAAIRPRLDLCAGAGRAARQPDRRSRGVARAGAA